VTGWKKLLFVTLVVVTLVVSVAPQVTAHKYHRYGKNMLLLKFDDPKTAYRIMKEEIPQWSVERAMKRYSGEGFLYHIALHDLADEKILIRMRTPGSKEIRELPISIVIEDGHVVEFDKGVFYDYDVVLYTDTGVMEELVREMMKKTDNNTIDEKEEEVAEIILEAVREGRFRIECPGISGFLKEKVYMEVLDHFVAKRLARWEFKRGEIKTLLGAKPEVKPIPRGGEEP